MAVTPDTLRTSYDEVPYPSYPLPQTHPDHLATLATLMNLEPPDPKRCRVLELGCASGGNLIPLALASSDSQFVGVDLSAEQIRDGQQTIDALELPNIDLRQLSILDIEDSFGRFDYIICHGVYSWVPPDVQRKILTVCQEHLVENGVGYVSYNTHPGWHMRGLIRNMMNFHVGRYPSDSPETRIQRARSLLEFLAKSASTRDHSYSALLNEQLQLLSAHSDAYLFHEHLEEHNEPVWFLDFCERLATHGLRYLADADFDTMVATTSFAPAVQQELDELAPKLLEKEQYMDFVRNRCFRQTLICHASQHPDYDIRAERVDGMFVASPLRPKSESPDLASDSPEDFSGPDELSVTASNPLVKVAFTTLGEKWPAAMAFKELVERSRARLDSLSPTAKAVSAPDRLTVGRALLTSFANARGSLVRLSLHSPSMATRVSDHPTASPLARLQSRQKRPLTNLRHEVVAVTPFDRHLLPLLDGTRARAELVAALTALHHDKTLNITREDVAVTDPKQANAILAEVLDRQLPMLLRAALLTG